MKKISTRSLHWPPSPPRCRGGRLRQLRGARPAADLDAMAQAMIKARSATRASPRSDA